MIMVIIIKQIKDIMIHNNIIIIILLESYKLYNNYVLSLVSCHNNYSRIATMYIMT